MAFDVPQADRDEALALCDENLMDRMLDCLLNTSHPRRRTGVLCMAAEDVWEKSCCYRPWRILPAEGY